MGSDATNTDGSEDRGKAWSPATSAGPVTPSDAVNLPVRTRGLYIGGAGDVDVVMANGSVVLFSAVPAGTVLPISVIRVNATLTTATLINWLG